MDKRIKFPLPVVVEGKYDKMKLSHVIDGHIIVTDGFGIFNKKEKLLLIKKLSENGVVVLCDSDGAGSLIRSHIMGAVPKDKLYNLYIPQIEGKERRKKDPSKEGTLGVEGMEEKLLYNMFEGLCNRLGIDIETGMDNGADLIKEKNPVTKADFFEVGLVGHENSAEKRNILSEYLSLPADMTPNALLGAVNILMDFEEFAMTVTKCGLVG